MTLEVTARVVTVDLEQGGPGPTRAEELIEAEGRVVDPLDAGVVALLDPAHGWRSEPERQGRVGGAAVRAR